MVVSFEVFFYTLRFAAWGVHQLDGVAMKIGERFIPPKKVSVTLYS